MVNLNTSFLKKKDIILTEKGLKLKLLPQNPSKADSASSSLNTTKQESWGLVFLSGTKGWKLSGQLLAVSYFLCLLLLPPCLPTPAAVKYSSHLNLTLYPVISGHLFWVSLHNRSEQDVITHNPVCCCIAPPFSRALNREGIELLVEDFTWVSHIISPLASGTFTQLQIYFSVLWTTPQGTVRVTHYLFEL